jgi:hypothetical protein
MHGPEHRIPGFHREGWTSQQDCPLNLRVPEMRYNENRVKQKGQPKPVQKKPETPQETPKDIEESGAESQEAELSADQLAILFICHRGHQSLISILQGVNSTRVPVGKLPIKEAELRDLLKELEKEGYLTSTELHDQTTWIATPKAKALET